MIKYFKFNLFPIERTLCNGKVPWMLKKVLVAINANKEPFIFRSVEHSEILMFCKTNHSFILLITVSKEEKNLLLFCIMFAFQFSQCVVQAGGV